MKLLQTNDKKQINFLIDFKGQMYYLANNFPTIHSCNMQKRITLTHALLTFMTGEVARMLKRGMQII